MKPLCTTAINCMHSDFFLTVKIKHDLVNLTSKKSDESEFGFYHLLVHLSHLTTYAGVQVVMKYRISRNLSKDLIFAL